VTAQAGVEERLTLPLVIGVYVRTCYLYEVDAEGGVANSCSIVKFRRRHARACWRWRLAASQQLFV